MGVGRDPQLSVDPAADLTAAVLSRMQEILGENNTIESHREFSVRHVSVEEALQELLDIQRSSTNQSQLTAH